MFGTFLALLGGCTLLTDADWAQRLDPDRDGIDFPYDCNDRDATVGEKILVYQDLDRDGYATDATGSDVAAQKCPGARGWTALRGDCDDTNAAINKGEVEVCDGFDNDCDGEVDDGLAQMSFFPDADGDGAGLSSGVVTTCDIPEGYVLVRGDCDDNDPLRSPSFTEVCDGIDNDCDNQVDEDLLIVTAADLDGDGYGDPALTESRCDVPAGYGDPTDCDDSNSDVYPGAPEDCGNGIDEGCRGFDERDMVFPDGDGDGYGVTELGVPACPEQVGWVFEAGDCDDSNAAINPGRKEVCPDGVDNDCDGQIDGTDQWIDSDGDGAGNPLNFKNACSLSSGWTTNALDCDDTDRNEPSYVATIGLSGASGTITNPYPSVADGLGGGAACLVLSPGVYAESIAPDHDVELWGSTTADETVLAGDGGDCSGVGWPACEPTVSVAGDRVKLVNLTVSGGTGMAISDTTAGVEQRFVCGGGVYVGAGALNLDGVVVTDGSLPAAESGITSSGDAYTLTSGGGGLCAVGGTTTMSDVVFTGNNAELGGALYVGEGADLVAARVAFTDNAASEGGAAWLGEGTAQFTQSRSWCNTAAGGGGAFWVGSPFATVSFTYADFLWNAAGSEATEVWAEGGAVVELDSVLVVGSDATLPALAGEGTVRAKWSVGSEVAGVTFAEVWYDSTVLTTTDVVLSPSCDGDRTNDSFVLPASSVAVNAGDSSVMDADGTRADAGSNGGPSGPW